MRNETSRLTSIPSGDVRVLDFRQNLDLVAGFTCWSQNVLVDVVLVLDECVSVLVDQVRVETEWKQIRFRCNSWIWEISPAVSWLHACSTSETGDTLSTWDWLVDFLHQSLGWRANITGLVIEALKVNSVRIWVFPATFDDHLPKHNPSWDIPQCRSHQLGWIGTCDRYDRIPCSKLMDEDGC